MTELSNSVHRVHASPSTALDLQDVTHERNWSSAMLAERAERFCGSVWLEGDDLTFYLRANAAQVRLCGGLQMNMARIAGSDSWALTVRSAALAQAVISYMFIIDDTFPIGQTVAVWRGPLAPAPVARSTTLAGTVQVERRFSAALDMERDLTLYLPPGHAVSGNYPVIYAADGEAVAGLAQVIEPLITAGSIPPLLIVGVHSGESDVRAMEYLPHINPQRFMAHARFFVTGVASWDEKELGATPERMQRAVFGFSNGGVFAGEMVLRHLEHFGVAMTFSSGYAPTIKRCHPRLAVRWYAAAGLFEAGFYEQTRAGALALERAGAEVIFSARAAGHDYVMWEEEFAAAVRWAFSQL